MLNTIEPRQVRRRSFLNETNKQTLCLLAPVGAPLAGFQNVIHDTDQYQNLLSETQRLRGQVYLDDGAISNDDLDSQQRYVVKDDSLSWHILLRNADCQVVGVSRMRLFPHKDGPAPFDQLHAVSIIERAPESVRDSYRNILHQYVMDAYEKVPYFIECGGLALLPEARLSRGVVLLISSICAMSRFQGGGLGVAAATERNGFSSILRRSFGFVIDYHGRTTVRTIS